MYVEWRDKVRERRCHPSMLYSQWCGASSLHFIRWVVLILLLVYLLASGFLLLSWDITKNIIPIIIHCRDNVIVCHEVITSYYLAGTFSHRSWVQDKQLPCGRHRGKEVIQTFTSQGTEVNMMIHFFQYFLVYFPKCLLYICVIYCDRLFEIYYQSVWTVWTY